MQTTYIFKFFEPLRLRLRLWCIGLIAGFPQITGEKAETPLPVRRHLSALQRKTGRRTALFLCMYVVLPDFRELFCWEI